MGNKLYPSWREVSEGNGESQPLEKGTVWVSQTPFPMQGFMAGEEFLHRDAPWGTSTKEALSTRAGQHQVHRPGAPQLVFTLERAPQYPSLLPSLSPCMSANLSGASR